MEQYHRPVLPPVDCIQSLGRIMSKSTPFSVSGRGIEQKWLMWLASPLLPLLQPCLYFFLNHPTPPSPSSLPPPLPFSGSSFFQSSSNTHQESSKTTKQALPVDLLSHPLRGRFWTTYQDLWDPPRTFLNLHPLSPWLPREMRGYAIIDINDMDWRCTYGHACFLFKNIPTRAFVVTRTAFFCFFLLPSSHSTTADVLIFGCRRQRAGGYNHIRAKSVVSMRDWSRRVGRQSWRTCYPEVFLEMRWLRLALLLFRAGDNPSVPLKPKKRHSSFSFFHSLL